MPTSTSIEIYSLNFVGFFICRGVEERQGQTRNRKEDSSRITKTEQANAEISHPSKETKPTSTHSYSQTRGRGRGRGHLQELKKSRKSAADFSREREEAKKAEEEKRKSKEEVFEGMCLVRVDITSWSMQLLSEHTFLWHG